MAANSVFPTHRAPPFALSADDSLPRLVLPAEHFLSAPDPALVSPVPLRSTAARYWAISARPDLGSLASADFDVDVQSGFLPPAEPIQRLSAQLGGGWDAIEEVLEIAQNEVRELGGGGVGRISDSWREQVKALEIPSTDLLTTLPLLRRAHVLLSFVGHLYIHSTYPALATVPSSIAIPWLEVSDRLGLPPILTYADTVLWNWKLIDPLQPLSASNVAINTTFTLSPSETAFFLLSLLCELHAPSLLRLMSATLDESFFADRLALPRIASYLDQIATIINELTGLFAAAMKGSFGVDGREKIVPELFYWEIRPWFNGGKWEYEGVEGDGNGLTMEWGGPSAGQSSLIHAIDLFLGVDHSPRPSPHSSSSDTPLPPATAVVKPVASTSTASMDPSSPLPPTPAPIVGKPRGPQDDSTFMLRASQYMPHHHREFLLHLSSLSVLSLANQHPLPSVRKLALKHPQILSKSFDRAVMAMKLFRDEHMKIATRFIVSQARREPIKESVFWGEWNQKRLDKEKEEAHVGTGGTELVAFLKGCRQRTVEALVST